MPSSQISSLLYMHESARLQCDAQTAENLNVPKLVADQAFKEMYGVINDIDNLIKGYSYYFLEQELTFPKGNHNQHPN